MTIRILYMSNQTDLLGTMPRWLYRHRNAIKKKKNSRHLKLWGWICFIYMKYSYGLWLQIFFSYLTNDIINDTTIKFSSVWVYSEFRIKKWNVKTFNTKFRSNLLGVQYELITGVVVYDITVNSFCLLYWNLKSIQQNI